MKSIAAAHLSFLITFHQADSLSQTVMAISWGRGETRTRPRCTVGPLFVPSSRNVRLYLSLFGPSLWVRPIGPAAVLHFCHDTLVLAGAET